jgi:hypothetical protein
MISDPVIRPTYNPKVFLLRLDAKPAVMAKNPFPIGELPLKSLLPHI